MANGAIAVDGVRHRVSGLAHRVSVREGRDGCALVLPGRDVSLVAQVTAPLARLTTSHGGVYELGTTEFDPSITVQPYPDG